MANQDQPEYKAISEHQGGLTKIVDANISSIVRKLLEKGLITQEQESKNAKDLVKHCILLTIEMAEADHALMYYLEIMNVLESCITKNFHEFLGKIEARRKALYSEFLSPKAVVATNVDESEYQVFISYKREDTADTIVDTIEGRLKAQKLTVFVDRSNLKPGDCWPAKLVSAIQTAPIFIAVLTEKYVSSHFCHGELYKAEALKKIVFPVVLENGWNKEVAGKPVEKIVKHLHSTSLQCKEDIEKNLDELVDSVVAKLGVPRVATGTNTATGQLNNPNTSSPDLTPSPVTTQPNDKFLAVYNLTSSDPRLNKLLVQFMDDHRPLLDIADKINDWENVATALGLSTAEIAGIKGNNPFSVDNQRFHALKRWWSAGLYSGNATFLVLIRVLLSRKETEAAACVCQIATQS